MRSVVGMASIDEETWSGFYVLEGSEFMLKEWLYRNGLSKDEIRQVTLLALPPINNEQTLRQGQVDVATLGGIMRYKALERGGIRLLFSDYDLFGELTTASYVLHKDFIANKPKAARRFVEGVSRALEWSRNTPRAEVIARLTSIIERRKRNEDTAALKYWRAARAQTKGGFIAAREFEIWIDWLVRDGQLAPGKVSAAALYTNQFNPYAEVATAAEAPGADLAHVTHAKP